jgi:hypothetical protein
MAIAPQHCEKEIQVLSSKHDFTKNTPCKVTYWLLLRSNTNDISIVIDLNDTQHIRDTSRITSSAH